MDIYIWLKKILRWVLSKLIDDKRIGKEEAVGIAEDWFYNNPREMYRINI